MVDETNSSLNKIGIQILGGRVSITDTLDLDGIERLKNLIPSLAAAIADVPASEGEAQ